MRSSLVLIMALHYAVANLCNGTCSMTTWLTCWYHTLLHGGTYSFVMSYDFMAMAWGILSSFCSNMQFLVSVPQQSNGVCCRSKLTWTFYICANLQSLASHEHANHAPSTDVQFDAQMCDGVQFGSVATALISSCWDPDWSRAYWRQIGTLLDRQCKNQRVIRWSFPQRWGVRMLVPDSQTNACALISVVT